MSDAKKPQAPSPVFSGSPRYVLSHIPNTKDGHRFLEEFFESLNVGRFTAAVRTMPVKEGAISCAQTYYDKSLTKRRARSFCVYVCDEVQKNSDTNREERRNEEAARLRESHVAAMRSAVAELSGTLARTRQQLQQSTEAHAICALELERLRQWSTKVRRSPEHHAVRSALAKAEDERHKLEQRIENLPRIALWTETAFNWMRNLRP